MARIRIYDIFSNGIFTGSVTSQSEEQAGIEFKKTAERLVFIPSLGVVSINTTQGATKENHGKVDIVRIVWDKDSIIKEIPKALAKKYIWLATADGEKVYVYNLDKNSLYNLLSLNVSNNRICLGLRDVNGLTERLDAEIVDTMSLIEYADRSKELIGDEVSKWSFGNISEVTLLGVSVEKMKDVHRKNDGYTKVISRNGKEYRKPVELKTSFKGEPKTILTKMGVGRAGTKNNGTSNTNGVVAITL